MLNSSVRGKFITLEIGAAGCCKPCRAELDRHILSECLKRAEDKSKSC